MPTPALPSIGTTPPPSAAGPLRAKDRDASEAGDAGDMSELSFGDLLDIINPLQHIPIVGAIYREITGDTIGFAAKTIGDTLFGGLPGFIVSVFDTAVEQATGKDSGTHLLAFLQGPDPDADVAALTSGDDGDGGTNAPRMAAAPMPGVSPAVSPSAPDIAEDTAAMDVFDPVEDEAEQINPPAPAVTAQAATTPPDTRRQAALYQARYASQPQPLQTRVSMNNVRGGEAAFPQDSRAVRGGGGFAGLPAPQVLAANPDLIAAARGGGAALSQDSRAARGGGGAALPVDSRAVRGGGEAALPLDSRAARGGAPQAPALPNGAWVQLMQAAPTDRPGGPNSLAIATYAKAIAGSNGGGLPLDSLGTARKR